MIKNAEKLEFMNAGAVKVCTETGILSSLGSKSLILQRFCDSAS